MVSALPYTCDHRCSHDSLSVLILFSLLTLRNRCWIGAPHKLWRLSIYCWSFTAMGGTAFLYTIVFYRLWREGRSSRYMPNRESSIASTGRSRMDGGTQLRPSGHHPGKLSFPLAKHFLIPQS